MNRVGRGELNGPTDDDVHSLRVGIPTYRSAYSAHDFSDLNVRERDREVASFLVQSVSLFSRPDGRNIVLELPAEEREIAREPITVQAYRDLFCHLARRNLRDCGRQLPWAAILLAIGLCFLLASHYVGESDLERTVRSTLSDAVQVGGWVAMWTAFATLFFQAGDALVKYFAFRILARLPINFEYKSRDKNNAPQAARRDTKALEGVPPS